MKIAVVNLTNGGLSGGYRKYLNTIQPLLVDHVQVDCVHQFCHEATRSVISLPSDSVTYWPEDDARNGYVALRTAVRDFSPDVVFIPTQRYMKFDSVPVVTMVRNMEPLRVPFGGNGFSLAINPPLEIVKNFVRCYAAWRSVRASQRVIAVSQHVRDFLVDDWKMPESKVGIVYHGISDHNPGSGRPPKELNTMDGNFIFTAGSIRPARGLDDLVDALPLILKDNDLMVVVAGSCTPDSQKYKRRLERKLKRSGFANRLVWAGHLNRDEVNWCFEHCRLFVSTTRAEACPNTTLEAMVHGCLTVSTTQEPQPEFLQDKAVYYTPQDSLSLAEAVATALSFTASELSKLSDGMKTLTQKYTWEQTVELTVKELQKASKIKDYEDE